MAGAVRDSRDIGDVAEVIKSMREAFFIGDTEYIRHDHTWSGFFVRSTHQPNNERQSAVIGPDDAALGFLVLTDNRSIGMHLWVDLVDRFEAADDNGFPAEDVDFLDLPGKGLPALDATEFHEEDVGLRNERSAESLRFVDVDVLVLRVHAGGASTLLEVSKNV